MARRIRFPSLIALIAVVTVLIPEASAQTATLRGFVRDSENGEPIQGVNIVLRDAGGSFLGGATDFEGLYVISRIPEGRYVFRATFIGFRAVEDTLKLAADEIRSYSFDMVVERTDLDEVLVEGDREGAGAAAVIAGLQSIQPQDIDLIPSPDVSGDLVNYLTTIPGVVSVGDQGGQLFVRGGEPTQNLVLLDGILIYQPFHLIGFYSAFPSSIINVTDVYAGGFGAKYGGRLSSVVSIASRNGNKRRTSGEVTIAPFVSGLRLEGPLIKNRVSILLSGRMSVIDQGVEKLISDPLPYAFSDQFGKLHADLTDESQLSITGLKTYDRGTIDPIGAADSLSRSDQVIWRNDAFGVRYLLLPRTIPVKAEILISTSRIENTFGVESNPARSSTTSQFSFALNMTHFLGTTDLNWGLFLSSIQLESELGGTFQSVSSEKENVAEVGAYIETELGTSSGLRVRPGLRIQSFPSNGISVLEPRLRLVYQTGIHQFSAAWGLYHQEILGLADRRDAGNVFTAWTISPRETVPKAMHAIAGYNVELGKSVQFSVEGYYKKLSNLSIAEWTAFPKFTTAFQPADGEVIGADVRLEISHGVFYGFVNYGYSEVEYRAEQSSIQLWFGTPELKFSPPHDRRHQINALVSLKLSGFNFSTRWQFGSGLPFNEAVGFDEFVLLNGPTDVRKVKGDTRVLYGKPYTGRLPTYHRLDVSLDRSFNLVSGSRLTLQAGLTNAYDRTNLFYVDLFTLRRLDQLPLIPSIGAKFEF